MSHLAASNPLLDRSQKLSTEIKTHIRYPNLIERLWHLRAMRELLFLCSIIWRVSRYCPFFLSSQVHSHTLPLSILLRVFTHPRCLEKRCPVLHLDRESFTYSPSPLSPSSSPLLQPSSSCHVMSCLFFLGRLIIHRIHAQKGPFQKITLSSCSSPPPTQSSSSASTPRSIALYSGSSPSPPG